MEFLNIFASLHNFSNHSAYECIGGALGGDSSEEVCPLRNNPCGDWVWPETDPPTVTRTFPTDAELLTTFDF